MDKSIRGLRKFAKYLAVRGASVAVSLLIAIFLVVFVANLGGKLDEIVFLEAVTNARTFALMDERIRTQLDQRCEAECSNKILVGLISESQKDECIVKCRDEIIVEYAKNVILRGMGLDPDQPAIVRIFMHYRRAVFLDFGRAMRMYSYETRSNRVIDIIAEALPRTILLFTTANIVIFFTELYIGLILSRRYGTLADKVAVGLAPLSSMPGWFYGIFLIMLLAIWPQQVLGIQIFPDGGWMSSPPPVDPLMRLIDVMWHMVLPIISWMIAYLPIGVYQYRTFFLLFSTEEYVEYARARGIPEQTILRRYILKPTLPPIITSFVLVLISSWMGAIITERIFRWPGLGTVLVEAIGGGVNIDSPVVVGIVVIYAYLLAVSVIALDIVYGIVDPRVRVEGG
ncbi:MAG: ABC transporter permease [Ignisphaera sp.]